MSMSSRNLLGIGVLCAALLGVATPAAAQQEQEGLAFLIRDLFGIVILDDTGHEAHFSNEEQLELINETFVSAFAPQLTTVPVGSPGGGLTFQYDADTGVFNRASDSFGSLFGERALTIGRGNWNVGVSAQTVEYDEYSDFDLTERGVDFELLHIDPSNDGRLDPAFEGDLIDVNTLIDISTDTVILFVTHGVTDRLDVSVAIPYLRTELAAEARLTLARTSTGELPNPDLIHVFDPADPNLEVISGTQAIARRSGEASGLGDILVRGKYRFRDAPGGGYAFGVDVRLATGDEEDLLGTGGTQSKVYWIGSWERGRVTTLANVGYTFSGVGGRVLDELPDEINATFGLAVAATPRVTFSGDLVGRRLLDAPSLQAGTETFQFRTLVSGQLRSVEKPTVEQVTDDVDIGLGVVGIRFNPVGSLLISGNAIVSLTDDGLRDEDVIPVLSVDYSF